MRGSAISDKGYLEIKGKVFESTPFPQTFLWWANRPKGQRCLSSHFSTDEDACLHHGEKGRLRFPIATGHLLQGEFAPGTDISR